MAGRCRPTAKNRPKIAFHTKGGLDCETCFLTGGNDECSSQLCSRVARSLGSVIVRGHGRHTRDVDATVWGPALVFSNFLDLLAQNNIVPRIANAKQFAEQNQVLLLHHIPSKTPVDISIAWLPFESAGSITLDTGKNRFRCSRCQTHAPQKQATSRARPPAPRTSANSTPLLGAAAFPARDVADTRCVSPPHILFGRFAKTLRPRQNFYNSDTDHDTNLAVNRHTMATFLKTRGDFVPAEEHFGSFVKNHRRRQHIGHGVGIDRCNINRPNGSAG